MTIPETLNRLLRALKQNEGLDVPRAELSGFSPEIAALADPAKKESAELAVKLNQLGNVVEKLVSIEIPEEVSEEEGSDARIDALEQEIYLLTEQIALLLPEEEGAGIFDLIPHDRGRVLVGEIQSHSGSGVYVVRQQEWGGSAWQDVASGHPMYDVSVRDIKERTNGAANSIIIFWQQLATDGTTELVGDALLTVDEKVATASGETADHLENVTAGHDPWIVLTESGGTLTWTHGGPGAQTHCRGCPGCSTYPITYLDTDALGHLRCFQASYCSTLLGTPGAYGGPCV